MHEIKVLDQQENSKAGLSSPSQSIAIRTIKIETLGDPWHGKLFSGIRLKGRWLTNAGFPPGERVAVTVVSPGSMQLRIAPESQAAEQRVSGREQPRLALEFARGAEQNIQDQGVSMWALPNINAMNARAAAQAAKLRRAARRGPGKRQECEVYGCGGKAFGRPLV